MSEQNPYAPPEAAVMEVGNTGVAPPLWNPTAAGAWSLLFTPIFGAYLHTQNWKALNLPEQASTSRKWLFGSIAVTIALTFLPMFLPQSRAMDTFGKLGGLALLIVWYYAIGKSQQTYVATRFGKHYPRRSWTIPLVTALAIVVVFVLVIFIMAALLMPVDLLLPAS